MSDLLPVLAVRQPWASLIACRYKDIELRSQETYKRGPFALYASRTKPFKDELEYLHPLLSSLGIEKLPRGKILSIGDISFSSPFVHKAHYKALQRRHLCPDSYYNLGLHYWVFDNMTSVEPVDFKFRGSVVWSSIRKDQLRFSLPFPEVSLEG